MQRRKACDILQLGQQITNIDLYRDQTPSQDVLTGLPIARSCVA